MTYFIKKTNGEELTEILDSAIDTTATDLTLIGKNVLGYGEFINENFVKLLENFASTSEPNNPIVGQLWYDLTEGRVKVYDGNGFAVASGPIVSPNAPLTPNQGDFWIDSKENQLYFYDGVDRQLAGPIYKDSQGISGFQVSTISDTFGNPRTVTLLWNAEKLLGIWSHHPEFTPVGLSNYSGTIKTGFNVNTNLSNIQDFRFHGVATAAETLVDDSGIVKTTDNIFFTDQDTAITGNLTILNSQPLTLGVNQETSFLSTLPEFQIRSNINNQRIKITTRTGGNFVDAITINSNNNRIGVYNNNPAAELDVNGNVIISGNLTVNGSTVTINSTNLTVDDKFITLAATNIPSDAIADGGGIVLKGTTDHTILWNDATDSWTSSENFNLPAGRAYRINNVDLLTQNTLAASVTTALGLTQIGTLTSLQVDNINIDGSTIDAGATVLTLNGVTISASNKRITNVLPPVLPNDAANKQYVDNIIDAPWQEVEVFSQNALPGSRFLVSTISNQVIIGLPNFAQPGDAIRLVDFDGTFDINSLVVSRYRKHIIPLPNGTAAVSGAFVAPQGLTTTGGSGTGLTVNVEISSTGTYTNLTTLITIVSQGQGYQTGDIITVPGTSLGGASPVNDLLFEIIPQDRILGLDQDLVVSRKNAAFGLIFANPNQGWVFTETSEFPPIIQADVVGNLTGNVLGNVTGNVLGNLEGNVTGNLTGSVLTSSQPNITSLGTLSSLTVSGNINGTLLGNVTGNVTGQLFGNVTGSNVTSATSLTLASTLSDIQVRSGNNGVRVSAFDNTGAQEQFAMQITPGTAPGNRSSTLLFGNVVVENITSTNINGSSFRLPQYTTAQRDARTMTSLNYGDLIYNTTSNKVQAYTSTGWVDLH